MVKGLVRKVGLHGVSERHLRHGGETFPQEVLRTRVVLVVAAGNGLAGHAADGVVAGRLDLGDGGGERPARALVDDGVAVAGECVGLEVMHAGAEPDVARGEAEEEARMGEAALCAVPEHHVEMVFVRPLVAREAGVAVDPHDRAADLRLELHLGRDLAQRGADGLDEGAGGRDIAGLVERAIGGEPVPVVVRRDAFEEGGGFLREAGETHRTSFSIQTGIDLKAGVLERGSTAVAVSTLASGK
jgi:hypothetical protein